MKIIKNSLIVLIVLSLFGCSQNNYLIKIIDDNQISKHSPFGYRSGYVSKSGDTIIPYDKYPRCYTDTFRNYAIVFSENDGLIGINRKEEKLFNAVWNGEGGPIEEWDGMVLIEENGKYGFANSKGKIVIKPIYSCAQSFHKGKAKVSFEPCKENDDEHFRWEMAHPFFVNKKGEKIERKSKEIKIKWNDNLNGDFSFIDNWDYPEGIYKNEFGQLSCDGLCPPEIDKMKDENGQIYHDSLKSFYQLIDTTHQFHSIQSDAWTYEWVGTNFITAIRKNADTIVCFTHGNSATHNRLILTITKNKCIPIIEVNSINKMSDKIYFCKSGTIDIDKSLWESNILKATFDFLFEHPENPVKPMYWKGNIYTKIENE